MLERGELARSNAREDVGPAAAVPRDRLEISRWWWALVGGVCAAIVAVGGWFVVTSLEERPIAVLQAREPSDREISAAEDMFGDTDTKPDVRIYENRELDVTVTVSLFEYTTCVPVERTSQSGLIGAQRPCVPARLPISVEGILLETPDASGRETSVPTYQLFVREDRAELWPDTAASEGESRRG